MFQNIHLSLDISVTNELYFSVQALPHIFSGGVDISVLSMPDPDQLASFWTAVQDMWISLYSTPLPAVAAINVSTYHTELFLPFALSMRTYQMAMYNVWICFLILDNYCKTRFVYGS